MLCCTTEAVIWLQVKALNFGLIFVLLFLSYTSDVSVTVQCSISFLADNTKDFNNFFSNRKLIQNNLKNEQV